MTVFTKPVIIALAAVATIATLGGGGYAIYHYTNESPEASLQKVEADQQPSAAATAEPEVLPKVRARTSIGRVMGSGPVTREREAAPPVEPPSEHEESRSESGASGDDAHSSAEDSVHSDAESSHEATHSGEESSHEATHSGEESSHEATHSEHSESSSESEPDPDPIPDPDPATEAEALAAALRAQRANLRRRAERPLPDRPRIETPEEELSLFEAALRQAQRLEEAERLRREREGLPPIDPVPVREPTPPEWRADSRSPEEIEAERVRRAAEAEANRARAEEQRQADAAAERARQAELMRLEEEERTRRAARTPEQVREDEERARVEREEMDAELERRRRVIRPPSREESVDDWSDLS